MMERDGFLRRWARLKRGGSALPQQLAGKEASPDCAANREDAATTDPRIHPAGDGAAARPTLEDAARLTLESDYSTFVGQGVDKAVQRLALKKLFSDPHFNRMDGLDIYIGDYNRADPLPASMLAALRQAQGFLQQMDESGGDDAGGKDARESRHADDAGSSHPAGERA